MPVSLFQQRNLNFFNVKDYGAIGNGTTDDTTALAATITAASSGGTVFLPPGTYAFSSQLSLSVSGVSLVGAGAGASILRPTSGFSGSQLINITANLCGVSNLTIAFATTTYSSNPSATGIQITAAQNILIQNVSINYINGWAIQSTANTTIRNKWTKFDNVFSSLCAKGIHIVGVSANNNAAHVLTDCILDQVATGASNGDGFFIEDCYDIECSNLECNVSAGSGSAFHIKGRCASIHLVNFVGGCDTPTGTGPGALIETGSNGDPTQIEIANSIFETSSSGIAISAGTEINISNCRLDTNATYGFYGTGGDTIILNGCSFNNNGQTAGASNYDFNYTGFGNVYVTNCSFITNSGTSVGQVKAAMNVASGHVQCINNIIFNTPFDNKPQVIRANLGYNPTGVLGPPTVSATTVAFVNPYSVDCTVFVTGGTVSAIALGGTATGVTSGTFRVPATQSIKLTYTVAPTWTWFGD
jgi:hypothetical protein